MTKVTRRELKRLLKSGNGAQDPCLNENRNHEMKEIFKGAATRASRGVGPFRESYVSLLDKGMKQEMARLTPARKIAAITLTGSKIAFLMPKSLQVRLGSQGFEVFGSFAKCGLAWPFHILWGRVPHNERRCAK